MDLLHIVAAIANPIRWESRIHLARLAIESWLDEPNVHITLVECAYGARPFELADLAGPRVTHVPVRARTLVWNKECLLNLGIARLPDGAAHIATLDADITFRKPGWATETLHALQLYPVVQPWSTAYDLGPNDEHIQTHRGFCRVFHDGGPVTSRGAAFWQSDGGPYAYPHCLTGDSLVVPGGQVLAASARPFKGDLVVIRTASGKEISCSPNHPILTDAGWVRADLFNVGDNVFRYLRSDGIAGQVDKQDAPARIEDVVRAFSERVGMRRGTVSLPDDLDNNRADCKVADVWSDGFLANERDGQKRGNMVLGEIGLKAQAFYRRGSHALLFEGFNFTTPSNKGAASTAFFAELGSGLREHAGADCFSDLGSPRGARAVPRGFAPPSAPGQRFNASRGANVCGDALFDEPSGIPFIHADDLGRFRRALAGKVERDQVVYVGRREFDGHLYDLQTEGGYIIADDIISHNSGYAWAWTREALDRIGGLFEQGGMGSGDHHMALALVGQAERSLPANVNGAYRAAVMRWQARATAHVNGKLGFVPGGIEHLFHGRKQDRAYVGRWEMFVQHDFDPIEDLKRNTYGVLEFSGAKPDLERAFDRYLRSRNEDVNAL